MSKNLLTKLLVVSEKAMQKSVLVLPVTCSYCCLGQNRSRSFAVPIWGRHPAWIHAAPRGSNKAYRALLFGSDRLSLAIHIAEQSVPKACRTYVEKCFEVVVEVVVVVEAAHRKRHNSASFVSWELCFWLWVAVTCTYDPAPHWAWSEHFFDAQHFAHFLFS